MALLRLTNGADIVVKLSVADVKSALSLAASSDEFVELPGEDGPVHIRPAHVIAIVDSVETRVTGFRAASRP
jgi:hypothetical protein